MQDEPWGQTDLGVILAPLTMIFTWLPVRWGKDEDQNLGLVVPTRMGQAPGTHMERPWLRAPTHHTRPQHSRHIQVQGPLRPSPSWAVSSMLCILTAMVTISFFTIIDCLVS